MPAVNVGWYDASDNIMVVNFEFFMCVEFMVDLAVGGLVVGDGSDNMTEKRFTTIYNEQSKMMQYVDNHKEEPNKWAIWNASETAQKLNKLSDENEQLKQQKDKWKQQCIHFKEMLDDMDIAYLYDEWIYEELKGDLE